MKHLSESELALYAAGDLSGAQKLSAGFHASRCEQCRTRVQIFRDDQAALQQMAAKLPEGLDWERLSAEMLANIHLGVEAGECVARPVRPRSMFTPFMQFTEGAWRSAVFGGLVSAALALVLLGGWWLNMPPQDMQSLSRSMRGIVHGRAAMADDRGPVIETSASGVELRENGGSLGLTQSSARLVGTSVDTQGSASANYVDPVTAQVTVTSLYVQQ